MSRDETERAAKKQAVVNVGIPPEANRLISAYCDRRSGIKRDIVGKILTWFVRQRPVAQQAILDELQERELREAAAELLERMAEELRRPPAGEMVDLGGGQATDPEGYIVVSGGPGAPPPPPESLPGSTPRANEAAGGGREGTGRRTARKSR
jgi:hypothetical protein